VDATSRNISMEYIYIYIYIDIPRNIYIYSTRICSMPENFPCGGEMTDDKTPKTSTILVLIDGLGDVDIPSLGNQTPLAYSKTPCMDTLAANGVCGLMDPVQVGLACGSDTAHLSIFGYDPRVYYRGRGAFETMGTGLYMEVGDIGFKCNFALLDPESGIVLRRRADREFRTWGRSLCDYLNEHIRLSRFPDYQVTFQYATEHRCGVRIRGPDLSDEISDTVSTPKLL